MAGAILLGISGNVFAGIITYTFEGKVTSITRDAEIVDGLIAIGDFVQFTFELDLDAPGTQVRYNGQFITRADHENDTEKVDYFWTNYIGGTDIGPIGLITSPDPNFFEKTNYGLSVNRKEDNVIVQDTGYLYGGSAYNWVGIENYSQNVQDWVEGSSGFSFRHIVKNQANEEAWIRGSLTLTSASTQVPEPSVLLLLGFGIMGLGSMARKFK